MPSSSLEPTGGPQTELYSTDKSGGTKQGFRVFSKAISSRNSSLAERATIHSSRVIGIRRDSDVSNADEGSQLDAMIFIRPARYTAQSACLQHSASLLRVPGRRFREAVHVCLMSHRSLCHPYSAKDFEQLDPFSPLITRSMNRSTARRSC